MSEIPIPPLPPFQSLICIQLFFNMFREKMLTIQSGNLLQFLIELTKMCCAVLSRSVVSLRPHGL